MNFLATSIAPMRLTPPYVFNALTAKKTDFLHPPIAILYLKNVLTEERRRTCNSRVTIVSKILIPKGADDTAFH